MFKINDLRRTQEEFEAVLARAYELPLNEPRVVGIVAALHWLTHRTPVAPITGSAHSPEESVLFESGEATGILLGVTTYTSLDVNYARGVDYILMWAMDRQDLPGWLRSTAA
jgi:hypothetical protein